MPVNAAGPRCHHKGWVETCMINVQHLSDSAQPAARAWHLIDEIDLVPLLSEHVRTEQLCRRLEACADALPELPDAAEIAALCDGLEARATLQAGRQGQLLDALFAESGPGPLADTLLSFIHRKHVTCAVQAQDLLAVLRPHTGTERGPCAATLSYMLRCFFDGCRSAIAFEQLAIRTLADQRLTGAGRMLLDSRLQTSCAAA
jgi:hypothetical protein